MGTKTEIPLQERSFIVALHFRGMSTRNIARAVNVSQSTVVRTIQRHKRNGNNNSAIRSGRPRVNIAQKLKKVFKKRPFLKKSISRCIWKRKDAETCSNVITLHNAGHSTREIGSQLILPPSTISRIVRRYKETGSILNRPYNR